MSAHRSLPFDEVKVEGPESLRYEAAAFLALPLHRRVSLIISGKARFFRKGTQVPADEALRALRQSVAPKAT